MNFIKQCQVHACANFEISTNQNKYKILISSFSFLVKFIRQTIYFTVKVIKIPKYFLINVSAKKPQEQTGKIIIQTNL